MAKTSPYQSVLLRLTHGFAALSAIAAWFTGFWVYDNYDRRWGTIGLPKLIEIQNIHGTIAVAFTMIFALFALYSLRLGYRRLIQPDALSSLQQLNQPRWWQTLHQATNTLMLAASVIAMITGRMMEEKWLPGGELDHRWYLAHLLAWVFLFLALASHVLMAVKIGGMPLILSMVNGKIRSGDNIQAWWQQLQTKRSRFFLRLEIIIIGGIAVALILPVFKP
ncbi:MAG: cytochrome b/b6 domain-containing protein [Synechococcaceae cyanobacterium RL_1_2]|nr:cytochrome b/b6 domain-containing protein [Synechococcaceae cyanobacterium RL_1_2]